MLPIHDCLKGTRVFGLCGKGPRLCTWTAASVSLSTQVDTGSGARLFVLAAHSMAGSEQEPEAGDAAQPAEQ